MKMSSCSRALVCPTYSARPLGRSARSIASSLGEALAALTSGRYGRTEKFDSMCDEAIQTAIRVTKEQQSAHSLIKEWMSAFKANVVDLRRRIWA